MSPISNEKLALIVEDSPTQALHLKTILEEQGLITECAEDGNTGIRLAQELAPAVIILDVELPDMNGYQVSTALKNSVQTASIPIIMLTRHDTLDALGRGIDVGVMDFIPKDTFADAVLLETLRQMKILQEQ
ncbi:MAG TPA: response regulator [Anaerolineales bacterium]|nr:response regulator [Anaerolineales bacterium]